MINQAVSAFTKEIEKAYDSSLDRVFLFGSCARGDYDILLAPGLSFYRLERAQEDFQTAKDLIEATNYCHSHSQCV